MRKQGVGYGTIAKQIGIPLTNVKSFCRRHNLTDEYIKAFQAEEFSMKQASDRPNRKRAPEAIECEVTVSYNENPSSETVADVMHLLLNLPRITESIK